MPGKPDLLLVDDNPLVRRLLERAIAPLAQVTVAASAAEALRKAAEAAPDLVVTDFQMPEMDGREFLQVLKSQPATLSIPVVLVADRGDLERLQPLRDSVEDFVEKPFFVGDAVARIKRILDKIALEKMAREAPDETKVRGSLAQMSVIDLLQSLELGRKTCALTLARNGEVCHLFFTGGQISHAKYAGSTGDEAVYQVLAWMESTGSFQIDFSASSKEHTTTRSTQGLLMEGLRLLDEANRDHNEKGS